MLVHIFGCSGATVSFGDRTPRYFDPASEWERCAKRCYRCGRTGHILRDCTYDEKQKPCFLCGKFGHQRQQCPNALCYRCGKPGHQARDCNETQAVHKICMRCGSRNCANAGAAKFEKRKCAFEYHSKDLAQVTCSDCGRKGHLSCNRAGAEVVVLEDPSSSKEDERNRFNKRERGERRGSYRILSCACCGEDTHHHSECRYNQANRQQKPMIARGREPQRYSMPNYNSNNDRFGSDWNADFDERPASRFQSRHDRHDQFWNTSRRNEISPPQQMYQPRPKFRRF